jgi:hypothetical protein
MGMNTSMNGMGPMSAQGIPGQLPFPPPQMNPMGQPPPPFLDFRLNVSTFCGSHKFIFFISGNEPQANSVFWNSGEYQQIQISITNP